MTPAPKVLSLSAAAVRVDAARRGGQTTIVHCHGCFDLLHIGHIKHLQAARRLGDLLVVTVTADRYVEKGPGRPAFPEALRADAVAALESVDIVAVADHPTAVEAINLLRPNYFVKGQEFEPAQEGSPQPPRLRAEIDAVRAVGGDVRFTHEPVFSSTALLHSRAISRNAGAFLDGFRARHSVDDVLSRLDALRDLRVLVVGETIIDEYNYCAPLGKSPKEAIVTMKHLRQERHAGGAAAVANHVAGLCGEVDLVTCLGAEESHEPLIRDRLRPNVTPRFTIRPDAPTITKRRYMWDPFLVKMFEVAVMNDSPLPAAIEADLLVDLERVLPRYDLVIAADYGHGFLSPRAAGVLAAGAPCLAVNTQANAANLGFNLITKYPRAAYVCIDEPELRLAAADRWTRVGDLADALCRRLACTAVCITRGRDGAVTTDGNGARWDAPVVSAAVVDRTGAGDACLAVTAPCVAAGMPLEMVALVSSAAGAIAVQVVGNRSSVEAADLGQLITTLLQ